MKVKIFQPNHNGKIEFTRVELEKLLNEVYNDGYHEGEAAGRSQAWTWTSPSISTQPYYATSTLLGMNSNNSDNNENLDKLTCNAVKKETPDAAVTTKIPTYTITMGREDVDNLTKTINSLVTGAKPYDVFTNLAKELNF